MHLHPKCQKCDACQPNGVGNGMYCAAGMEYECIGLVDVYVGAQD
jgi:hypothetical protein